MTELNAKPIRDLRIVIPEGFDAGTGDQDYLDFDLNPPTLAEIQRSGLYLLTQLSEGLDAHNQLRKVTLQRDKLNVELGAKYRENESLNSAYLEIEGERDRFRDLWREVVKAEKAQIQQLTAQVASLQESAAFDKDYLAEVERRSALLEQLLAALLPDGQTVEEALDLSRANLVHEVTQDSSES